MKRCIICKTKISEEEAQRVRNRYPIMDDEEYTEFAAHLRYHAKRVKNEECYFEEDFVEVLCEKCWQTIMKECLS